MGGGKTHSRMILYWLNSWPCAITPETVFWLQLLHRQLLSLLTVNTRHPPRILVHIPPYGKKFRKKTDQTAVWLHDQQFRPTISFKPGRGRGRSNVAHHAQASDRASRNQHKCPQNTRRKEEKRHGYVKRHTEGRSDLLVRSMRRRQMTQPQLKTSDLPRARTCWL